MGETTDQLRQQVEQKREDASQKIDQIEQQVMNKAQDIESKVSDTAQQVKAQMDWRHQVEERPLMAVGAALVGGMLLGGIVGKGNDHQSTQQIAGKQASHGGGVTDTVRKAAKDSGLDNAVENFANAAFGMIGERMREMTDRTFPGMLDKVQHTANRISDSSSNTASSTPPYADGPRDSSTVTG
jgi:ElaB/YqjD/DUF883 family membrane-anchored ribosome-binding protein